MAGNGIDLAKAYVQIVPSAKGIGKEIQKNFDNEVGNSGEQMGASLGKTIIKGLAAIGIGKLIKDSVFAGGELEQSLGGVETLFKDSADKVKKNAENAFKTSGLSANDYMQNVTSFSASLLQSVAGDTDRAADVAEMAMVDMADNANKMGTDMQSIQNAYQGFAKQNYTMLDNLKLGYGGTKTEMARLLADAEKITGIKYDMSNLSDVYEAIHVIQNELNITGTTALEAAETLQGSASAMKAAFQNLIANLALGEDISSELVALKETVNVFFVDNLIPMLANILAKVPEIIGSLIDGAIGAIDYLGQSLAEKYPGFAAVFENLETIVVGLTAAFVAYKSAMAISGVIDIVKKSMAGLNLVMNANPIMLVVTLLAGLAAALITAYKTNDVFRAKVDSAFAMIRNTVSGVITSLKNWFTVTIPNSINTSIQWFREMPGKVINAMSSLIGRMRTLGAQIFNSFKGGLGSFFNIGANLIRGLWNGIASVKNWILSKIGGFTKSVLNSVKSFFGIHSPSRVFRDEVGAMLGQGLALGIEDEVSTVSRAMDELQNATVRDMNSVVGIDTYTNANVRSGFAGSTLNANLSMGEKTYRLMVQDFTNEQSRQTELGLAY